MWSNLNPLHSHPRSYSTEADLQRDGSSLFLRPWQLPHRCDFGLRGTSDHEPFLKHEVSIIEWYWMCSFIIYWTHWYPLIDSYYNLLDWWCKLRRCNMHSPRWSCWTASNPTPTNLERLHDVHPVLILRRPRDFEGPSYQLFWPCALSKADWPLTVEQNIFLLLNLFLARSCHKKFGSASDETKIHSLETSGFFWLQLCQTKESKQH